MLKIVNAQEMQQIDRITIEHYGIAGTLLMERAGLSVVAQINKLFPERKVFVLCGGGNNGGDGLVIARVLHNQGRDVEVLLTVSPDTLRGDARINYNAAKKFGVKIKAFKGFLTRSSSHPGGTCLIVDALLGTGLNKEVRRPLSDIIGKVNAKSFPVISVDRPFAQRRAGWTTGFGKSYPCVLDYPGKLICFRTCTMKFFAHVTENESHVESVAGTHSGYRRFPGKKVIVCRKI